MDRFVVDFSQRVGAMKRMHSVNNGPVGRRGGGNARYFTEAGIPFARLHDSAFNMCYGGSHSVDVIALFPNFDADVNDPDSYDFTLTDQYLRTIEASGTKVFYRLGSRIEHEIKKYGTQVPKDFLKWAQICEHIILHYNEGWADGMHMGIEYWEIWNEPDCRNADGSNPCWQGTEEEFCEFFYTALKYLKGRFPKLRIGGPAFCGMYSLPFVEKLLKKLTEGGERVPLDFFSYHAYAYKPEHYRQPTETARDVLDRFGYRDTEMILDEWNYVKHWTPPEEVHYSMKVMKTLKGASFVAGSMCVAQDTAMDQFMYYDARPCAFNGMFDSESMAPLKGYYPFKAFSALYTLSNEVKSEAHMETRDAECEELYGCAASNGEQGAVLITRYLDRDAEHVDEGPVKDIEIELNGLPECAELEFYLLDDTHDLEKLHTDTVYGGRFSTKIPFKLFDLLLIQTKKRA